MTGFPPLPRYLTLEEAAQAMTDRTSKPWTERQILGCAERHEITVFARIGHAVKFVRVHPMEGRTNAISAEAGSLPILDAKAIQALLLTGEASSQGWEELTTIDFFGEPVEAWATVFQLSPGEQAPRVQPDDCRVTAAGVLQLVKNYTASEAEQEPQAAPPAPVADSASNAPACDFSILATREQLIEAFGRFTGMDASWFKNITDTPALLAARKVTGQGGRGHIGEPWFCPFEVMQWLADSNRRKNKSRKLSTEKAWELLEKNFPKVHSAHSVADPRAGD